MRARALSAGLWAPARTHTHTRSDQIVFRVFANACVKGMLLCVFGVVCIVCAISLRYATARIQMGGFAAATRVGDQRSMTKRARAHTGGDNGSHRLSDDAETRVHSHICAGAMSCLHSALKRAEQAACALMFVLLAILFRVAVAANVRGHDGLVGGIFAHIR